MSSHLAMGREQTPCKVWWRVLLFSTYCATNFNNFAAASVDRRCNGNRKLRAVEASTVGWSLLWRFAIRQSQLVKRNFLLKRSSQGVISLHPRYLHGSPGALDRVSKLAGLRISCRQRAQHERVGTSRKSIGLLCKLDGPGP